MKKIYLQKDQYSPYIIILIALCFTLFLSVPSLLNPGVRTRSDNRLHAGIVNSINIGIVPPEMPNLAGIRIQYYWFYDMFNSCLSSFSFLEPVQAIHLTNCSSFFTLLLFISLFSRSLGGDIFHSISSMIFLMIEPSTLM